MRSLEQFELSAEKWRQYRAYVFDKVRSSVTRKRERPFRAITSADTQSVWRIRQFRLPDDVS